MALVKPNFLTLLYQGVHGVSCIIVTMGFPQAAGRMDETPAPGGVPFESGSRSRGGRTVWSWIVSSLLAAVLLYFSLRGVEWGRVWKTIAAAQWQYLAAGALISCGSYFVRAFRWRILLNAEAHFTVSAVFWANMAGYLGNNFLPARGGELVRTFIITSQSSLSNAYVLTTALSERMMDAIALVLWSSVVLLGVNPKPRWLDDVGRTAAIVAAAGALAIFVLPHTGNLCQTAIRRLPLPTGLRDRLLRIAEQILLGLRAFHSVRRLAAFSVLTAIVWMADALAVMVGSRGLGLHIPFQVAALLLAGMGLGSALPATPGYVGIYQFVGVTVLTPFGISRDAALAYMFVGQAVGYVVVLAFGLPGLYRFKGWRASKGAAS
jgi:glycosyltransferase 2 family protein